MRRFTGVCLITADVPGLTAFYRKVLEIEPEGDDVHAAFSTSVAELAIYSVQGTESLAPGATEGMGTGGFTLGFCVQDVDAEYARLQALGIPIVKPPATYPWGARSVWFFDPDGNLVDFRACEAIARGGDAAPAFPLRSDSVQTAFRRPVRSDSQHRLECRAGSPLPP